MDRRFTACVYFLVLTGCATDGELATHDDGLEADSIPFYSLDGERWTEVGLVFSRGNALRFVGDDPAPPLQELGSPQRVRVRDVRLGSEGRTLRLATESVLASGPTAGAGVAMEAITEGQSRVETCRPSHGQCYGGVRGELSDGRCWQPSSCDEPRWVEIRYGSNQAIPGTIDRGQSQLRVWDRACTEPLGPSISGEAKWVREIVNGPDFYEWWARFGDRNPQFALRTGWCGEDTSLESWRQRWTRGEYFETLCPARSDSGPSSCRAVSCDFALSPGGPPPCPPDANLVGRGASAYCQRGAPASPDAEQRDLPAGCEPRRREPRRDCAGDPVDLSTGELFDRNGCLQVPGLDGMISGSVLYESSAAVDGVSATGMPIGWTRSYGRRLVVLMEGGYRLTTDDARELEFDASGRPLDGEVDDGRLERREENGLMTFVRRFRDGTREVYGFDGRLAALEDTFGNRVSWTWFQAPDRDDLWYEVIYDEVAVRSMTRVYQRLTLGGSPLWRLVRIRQGAERRPNSGAPFEQYRLEYDPMSGDLRSIVDPEGHSTRYRYDERHRVVEMCSPGRERECTEVRYSPERASRVVWQRMESATVLELDWTRRGTHDLELRWTSPEWPNESWQQRYLHDRWDRIVRVYPVVHHTRVSSGSPFVPDAEVTVYESREYDSAGFEWMVTGPSGTRRVTVRDPVTHDVLRTSESDPRTGEGATWVFRDYTSRGAPRVIIDPDERRTEITYSEATGAVERVELVSPTERLVTTYEHDSVGRIVRIVGPDGTESVTTYDRAEPVSWVQRPTNLRQTWLWSHQGQLLEHVDARGVTHRYDADARGRVHEMSVGGDDPSAVHTRIGYDALGRPTSVIEDVRGAAQRTQLEWRAVGEGHQVVSTTAPGNERTTFRYDPMQRLRAVSMVSAQEDGTAADTTVEYETRPEGELETTRVEGAVVSRRLVGHDGLLSWEQDGEGRRTEYVYSLGRVVQVRRGVRSTGARSVETYDYSNAGLLESYESSEPRVVERRTWDRLGRLSTVQSAQRITELSYDTAARTVTVTEGGADLRERVATVLQFDGAGRLVNRSRSVGADVYEDRYRYGVMPRAETGPVRDGWNVSYVERRMRGGESEVRRFQYDALGRLARVREDFDGGPPVTYERQYDGLGRITVERTPTTRSLPASPLERRYTYDAANRVVGMTESAGMLSRSQTWVRRPHGQLAGFVDFDNTYTAYKYDPRGRLEGIDYASSVSRGAVPTLLDTRFEYDASNLLRLVRDPQGETAYQYDEIGRLARRTRADHVVEHEVRSDSLTTRVDGWEHRASIDPTGRLTAIGLQSPAALGLAASARYDIRSDGRLSRVLRSTDDGASASTTFAWDTAGRMRSLETTMREARDTRVLQYDDLSRVRAVTGAAFGQPAETRSREYRYDLRGQLVSSRVRELGSWLDGLDAAYAYDIAGNRTSAAGRARAHDGLGRITSSGVTYDARGNLTFDGQTRFSYDSANRLIRSERTGLVVQYVYDGLGQLVRQVVNGRRIDLVLDESGGLARVLSTEDDAGERHEYVWGPEGLSMHVVSSRADSLAGTALFVRSAANSANDQEVAALLGSLGLRVTPVAPESVTVAQAETFDLVVVSETIGASSFGARLRGARVPVVVLEPFVLDDMGMSTAEGVGEARADALQVLSGALDGGLAAGPARVYEYGVGQIGYGRPGANATCGARLDDVSCSLFGYARGAQLADGTVAPAARVAFFAMDGRSALTEQAEALFEGALRFALGRPRTGGVRFPVLDERGSVTAELDERGNLVNATAYDDWGVAGRAREGVPHITRGIGYAGEWQSPDGTIYLRARVYHPGLGVFLQRDSFPGFDAEPLTMNRYAYGAGDPIGNVDPSGHFSLTFGQGASAPEISFVNEMSSPSMERSGFSDGWAEVEEDWAPQPGWTVNPLELARRSAYYRGRVRVLATRVARYARTLCDEEYATGYWDARLRGRFSEAGVALAQEIAQAVATGGIGTLFSRRFVIVAGSVVSGGGRAPRRDALETQRQLDRDLDYQLQKQSYDRTLSNQVPNLQARRDAATLGGDGRTLYDRGTRAEPSVTFRPDGFVETRANGPGASPFAPDVDTTGTVAHTQWSSSHNHGVHDIYDASGAYVGSRIPYPDDVVLVPLAPGYAPMSRWPRPAR